MAENSKIQWTTHTFNPWRGCTKVSPGCANCYAETLSGRNPGTLGVWGPNGTRVVAAESAWKEPLKWNRVAQFAKELYEAAKDSPKHADKIRYDGRPRVFCASLADVFEDWAGPMVDSQGEQIWTAGGLWGTGYRSGRTDEKHRLLTMGDVRARLFRLIDATPHLDWLLLTKRPENVLRMCYDAWCKQVQGHVSQNEGDGRRWAFPPNVWLGASVENQEQADKRIPELLKVPAAVRFLSCEPLLGPVDLRPKAPDSYGNLGVHYRAVDPTLFPPADDRVLNCFPAIDWVIVGGESGPGARPCNVEWVRSIVRQCWAAGVPCFVKQLGAVPLWHQDEARTYLKDRKGGDMAEWPADLRVREFPEVTR